MKTTETVGSIIPNEETSVLGMIYEKLDLILEKLEEIDERLLNFNLSREEDDDSAYL